MRVDLSGHVLYVVTTADLQPIAKANVADALAKVWFVPISFEDPYIDTAQVHNRRIKAEEEKEDKAYDEYLCIFSKKNDFLLTFILIAAKKKAGKINGCP